MPVQNGTSGISKSLIDGINDRSLFQTTEDILQNQAGLVDKTDIDLAIRANETCRRISQETKSAQDQIEARLNDAGILASAPFRITEQSGLQYHEFPLRVDGNALDQALDVLTQEQFAVDEVLRRKWRSVQHGASGLYLMAWDQFSTRLRLSWKEQSNPILEKLRPAPSDFALAPIPHAAWPLYFGVKPVRIAIEKITGRRTADRLGLKAGSFSLGTPPALLPGLFEFANVGPEDTFVDLGCGDGRVVIDAAKRYGCRALGVERNAALVEEARSQARAEQIDALVQIIQGSALDADISAATVVFLFLPREVVVRLLPIILGKLRRGARILVHEQHHLPILPGATRSRPIFAESSMTVAHLWDVGGAPAATLRR